MTEISSVEKKKEETPVIMATATLGDFPYMSTSGARFAMP